MSQLVAYIYPVAKRLQPARGKFELQIKRLIGADMKLECIIYHMSRAEAKDKAAKLGATPWNYS